MIQNPITMRPLLADEADAELADDFHETVEVLKAALFDPASGMNVAATLTTDADGKESLVLCLVGLDEEGQADGIAPIAVLLPRQGRGQQASFSDAYQGAFQRRLESESLRKATEKMEREQAALDLQADIESAFEGEG